MLRRTTIDVPINRVEGDLEVRVEIEHGTVTDAWTSGVMYRGFENILVGRGALDGLVITPRICGICSTAHLHAAALALEAIAGLQPPPNAVRVRNLSLMAETLQSDIRHTFLTFAADFANSFHDDCPLFQEAVRRYQPLKGETAIEVIRETKKIVEIIAILGGQWPHSSYMVPGGTTCVPSDADLMQCLHLLKRYRDWYERRILGCSLERWLEVQSLADLDRWLDERPSHRESDLGFYIRFARDCGLNRIGRGPGNFISYGTLPLPEPTRVRGRTPGDRLFPAGFAQGTTVDDFSQTHVAEHVAHSWFVDYESGRHPFDGETRPYATGHEGDKYSWCKAPRYRGLATETGPLAELMVAGHPLFQDLFRAEGPSVFSRQLARIVRQTELLPAMESWLRETHDGGKFYLKPGPLSDGEGAGLVHAPRGVLGHWVKIAGGKITHYQIITPTSWNASPRDSRGTRGPWEEALVGTEVKDPSNPVEVGHVVRSFDACLVCTVHTLRAGRCSGAR
jgi:hydrogenase large subunit